MSSLSPLEPLLAKVFMSSLEEKLELEGKLPDYYRRYFDDTLTIMLNITAATDFLNTMNHAHPSVSFTMEIEKDGMLPFLGNQLLNRAPQIETKGYVTPTNTGLLVHYQSHVDNRYKPSLLTTMIDRAHRLSSTWLYFSEECERLKSLFSRLDYPHRLINSTINTFINSRVADQQPLQASGRLAGNDVTRVIIPFKDQHSANIVKMQLKDLSIKLQTTIQPVFVSRKIGQDRKECETKPQLVNQECVVYQFKCNLCDIGSYMLVTHAGIYTPAWMAIKARPLQYASTMTTTTRVLTLRNSLALSRFKFLWSHWRMGTFGLAAVTLLPEKKENKIPEWVGVEIGIKHIPTAEKTKIFLIHISHVY